MNMVKFFGIVFGSAGLGIFAVVGYAHAIVMICEWWAPLVFLPLGVIAMGFSVWLGVKGIDRFVPTL